MDDRVKRTKDLKIIEGAIDARNTLTESQFSKFKSLFRRDLLSNLSSDEITKLSDELSTSISIFHPIKIVKDYANDVGIHEIVLTLPPIYNTIPTVNVANEGKIADSINIASMRQSNNPTDISIDRESNKLITIIKHNDPNGDIEQQKYNDIMERLEDPTGTSKKAPAFLKTCKCEEL